MVTFRDTPMRRYFKKENYFFTITQIRELVDTYNNTSRFMCKLDGNEKRVFAKKTIFTIDKTV